MTSVLQLGTWNVQTMLLAGKMQETANKLKIYNIHIAALQETRWSNEGWIYNKDNTLIYGGETNITGRNGTGLIFDKDGGEKSLIGFEPVNGRISKIQIKGKFYNNTIINSYTLNDESELEDTEKFY
jgi:hypothetical protein